MKRNLALLNDKNFDLLVIGGWIYGACIAWEGILCGLSVALIEKSDFTSATSANSLKIIHGGLRYLQHGDIKRACESSVERRILMQIAPHLIHPIPVIIPLYGNNLGGRWMVSMGLRLNDMISYDRNHAIDPQKNISSGRIISKNECLDMTPGISKKGLVGGALFYDAQVYNSERLVLEFLQSASEEGAVIANFVKATDLIKTNDRVKGVKVEDTLTGECFEIFARTVVNATGPWSMNLEARLTGRPSKSQTCLAKAINLVTKPVFTKNAVGIPSQEYYKD